MKTCCKLLLSFKNIILLWISIVFIAACNIDNTLNGEISGDSTSSEPFVFTNLSNVSLNTLLTSEIVKVSGLSNSTNLVISGGSPVSNFDLHSFGSSRGWKGFKGLGESVRGFEFNDDGSKVYIGEGLTNSIHEFHLKQPFNIDSAHYYGVSFDVSGQLTGILDIIFNNVGSKMFVVDGVSDEVEEYNLTVPYDLSTASYNGTSFSVSAQEGNLDSISFNNDGTWFYATGSGTNRVYLYSVSTPYDLSTANFTGVSSSFSSAGTGISGLEFSDDGTYLFVSDTSTDIVYCYQLSIPFDINTMVRVGLFETYRYTSNPSDIKIKPDGTRLFIFDIGEDQIFQFDLSIPYNLSSTTPPNEAEKFIDVRFKDSFPVAVRLSNDGRKLFVLGASNTDRIYVFNLSTPFDITSSTDSGVSFGVGSQDISPRGFTFNDDGTKMYVAGDNSNRIYQYTLTTAFDLATASYDTVNFSINGQETEVRSVVFNNDGSKMFISGVGSNLVQEYDLTVPFDIGGGVTPGNTLAPPAGELLAIDVFFSNDGSKLFILGNTNDSIYEYDMGTPFDITTAVQSGVEFGVSSYLLDPNGIFFSPDGMILFLVGDTDERVRQFDLSSPYDLTSPNHGLPSLNFSAHADWGYTVRFVDNDTKLFLISYDPVGEVYRYDLSTPGDLDTATYSGNFVDVSAQDVDPADIAFNLDGSKMFVMGNSTDRIYQYNLGTPYDLTTAVYSAVSLNVTGDDNFPLTFEFNSDGTLLLMAGSNSELYEYSLATPFDLATGVSTGNSVSIATEITGSTTRIQFDDTGTKLFTYGNNRQTIFEYDLSTPYDVMTISYTNKFFNIGQLSYPNGTTISSFAMNLEGSKIFAVDAAAGLVSQFNKVSYPSEYRICSDSQCSSVQSDWSNSSRSVSSGDYVQLRQFSHFDNATDNIINIILGTITTDWTVTTED